MAECENGYLFVGQMSQSNTGSKPYALFINKNGDVIWEIKTLEYIPNSNEYFRDVVFKDGYFYVGGFIKIENKDFSQLMKIDMEGNVIFKRTFGAESTLAMDNIVRKMMINQNGLLIATSGFNNNGTEGELVQLDLEANVIWKKNYSYYNNSNIHFEVLSDGEKTNDDGYLLTLITDNAFKSIIKVNDVGNEIWRKSFNTWAPSSLTSDSLLLLAATTYKQTHTLALFTVGTFENQIYYPREDFALIEYDENGVEIKHKRFNNPYGIGASDIFTNKENEISIISARAYGDTLPNMLSIIKINEHWEIDWNHYYNDFKEIVNSTITQAGEIFSCAIITSDGGYIFSGLDAYDNYGALYLNSTIVKTDCEGNIEWNYRKCASPSFEEITVFPNPSSTEFIIVLPDIPDKSNIMVQVYNMIGQLIGEFHYYNENVIVINSSDWSSGVYNFSIYINDELKKNSKLVKVNGY